MTEQYLDRDINQSINQEIVQLVSFDTTSLTPVDTLIGTLQSNQGMAVQLFGGGIQRSNPIFEAYRVRGNSVISRLGPAIAVATGLPTVTGNVGAPTIEYFVDDTPNVFLRVIPGTTALYLHRINVRKILIAD